jgi:polysaccharide deacetylase 2 family uncharacterized protein YibQ
MLGRIWSRPLRLVTVFIGVFAVGVGLGAGLGVWLTKDERPRATITISEAHKLPKAMPPIRIEAPVETHVAALPIDDDALPINPAPAPETVEAAPVSPPNPTPPTPGPAVVETGDAAAPTISPSPSRSPVQSPITAPAAWRRYAIASNVATGRPMIAIVLDDLGNDQKRSRNAIALPAPLTLSFIPYGYNLPTLTQLARASGHELMVHVNMEPLDHDVDPGPNALLTSLTPVEIRRRLDWALSRFDGFTGINNHMGSRFTAWPDGMEIVLQTLNERGLLFLDSLTNTRSIGPALARVFKTPFAVRDVFIDHDRTDEFIIKQLALTERLARRNGHAIAIGHPHDLTVNRLKQWLATVESRGFTLVPVSAIIRSNDAHG